MKRAARMCKSCPFRGIDESERSKWAVVEPENWPCHTEHPMGWGDTQCRGHFEAQRKYPPKPHELERLVKWRNEVNAWLAYGGSSDKAPKAPKRDPRIAP